jgi:hypothetical protein
LIGLFGGLGGIGAAKFIISPKTRDHRRNLAPKFRRTHLLDVDYSRSATAREIADVISRNGIQVIRTIHKTVSAPPKPRMANGPCFLKDETRF